MTTERHYAVLLAPHVSEKVSNLGEGSNQYAFKVARRDGARSTCGESGRSMHS